MSKNKELPHKQAKFVLEFLKDFNATQAAIRAGYSKKTARSQGQRLLTYAAIRCKLQEIHEKTESEAIVGYVEACEILSRKARGKAPDYFDEHGKLNWDAMRKVNPEAIAGIKTREKYCKGEAVAELTELKIWDGTRAIEILAKMRGYNAPEKVETESTITVKHAEGWGEDAGEGEK